MAISKTIEKLSLLNGVCGNEALVAKELYALAKPYVDSLSYDNLGSLITKKGQSGPKILIGAHLDEVGLMVTKITKEGFIKFQTLGGWFSQVMLAQQWQITTAKGIVYGVTGCKPPHLIPVEQRSKAIEIDAMYLDIGVSSYQEAIDCGVAVGDMITPATTFRTLANPKYLMGKALDNRVGCAVVYEVLKNLKGNPNQAYGVYTVLEEVGSRGGKTSGYLVNPDLAIVIDTGIGNDVLGGDPSEQTLGAGPQIVLYDAGMIAHHGLRRYIIDLAKRLGISYQEAIMQRGATDGRMFQLNNHGVPTVAITIPTRYMHSHTSIVHLDDVNNTVKLVSQLLLELNSEVVAKIINS